MQRPARAAKTAVVIGLLLGSTAASEASHLVMGITVHVGAQKINAGTDTSPPEYGKNPRPILHMKTGEALHLLWSVKNSSSQKLDTLLVHVFIAREGQAGQKEVPDRSKGYFWETIYATALEPAKETHGETELSVDVAGTYLLRIESMFTNTDHEHFSAVDLVVE